MFKRKDFLRQTDGLRFVVSSRAVFDDDFRIHGRILTPQSRHDSSTRQGVRREDQLKLQTPNSKEAPRPKLQTPEKLQAPSSKHGPRFGAWNLGFIWCLELGFWCLDSGPSLELGVWCLVFRSAAVGLLRC